MSGVISAGVGHEGEGGVEGSTPLPPRHGVSGQEGAHQPHLLLHHLHYNSATRPAVDSRIKRLIRI